MHATPWDQQTYQVRSEWGVDGLGRLAPADIVIVIDVLGFGATVMDAVANGNGYVSGEAAQPSTADGAGVAAAAALDGKAVVLLGGLRNAAAVARAARTEQERRGGRTSIAVIAAGKLTAPGAQAPLRIATEDQLGAGAVIDALGSLGIDHTSPEAAVAAEGFRALRGAVRHLVAATASGRELAADGRGDEVAHAAAVDASSVVPVLRGGVFIPYE